MKTRIHIFHLVLFVAITCVCVGIALFTKGTGDDGDSVMHFLHSHYSIKYSHLFLDMWNKPVFTVLSCGFSQFGFTGLKCFNALVGVCISVYLYSLLKHLNKSLLWVIIFLPLCSPFYLTVLNSGLTEPLFALAAVAAIYYYITNRYMTTSILVGFLPFMRQEGYILMIVVIGIFIYRKQFKHLPFVLLGHVLVSIIGAFYYRDVLWVFKHNANLSMSHYGTGGWFDYFDKLTYILGIPLYVLFGLGIISYTLSLFYNKDKKLLHKPTAIIYLCLFSVFFAHVVFWKFGWFKSFGMNRNLITIFPLMIFVAHDGLLFFLSWFKQPKLQSVFQILWITYLVVFPFTSNPAAINWESDFCLTDRQKLMDDLAMTLKKEPVASTYYVAQPYLIYKLGIDPFDTLKFKNITILNAKSAATNSIIIWDSWFSVTEGGIHLNALENNSSLQKDTVINYHQTPFLAVFRTK